MTLAGINWRSLLGTRRPLDEVIYVLIGALALLLGTGAIYLNWQQAQKTNLQAVQTRQVVSSLRSLLLLLYRGETAQRGYMLTEEDGYLAPYRRSLDQMPRVLERLHQLADAQPAIEPALREIDRLARAKMGEIQTAVELVEGGNLASADLLVRGNFGKQTMDQLVEKLEALEQEVYEDEERFNTDLQERIRRTAAITVVCCVALFALFAIENHRVASRRRAAEHSSEVKSAFLASMSHELRTPLNAIIGYSQMLQEEASDDGRASDLQDLRKIEGAGKHLLELINSILELSKIEAGRLELHPGELSVESVVHEVQSLVAPIAQKNRNELRVEIEPGIGPLYSDATRLKQCLLNLASNASKFTTQGRVLITVRRVEREGHGWVEFAVSDTGPGIARDDLHRLFEPFSQLDTRQRGKVEGSGLGLVITRRFCRLLGGDVTVESQRGVGSTFTMRVPMEVTPGYFAAKVAAVPLSPPGPRVLVIDDDPAVHDLVGRMLARHGLQVVGARNGTDGLRLAREMQPSVITLDVVMEGINGWEVLRELKSDPALRQIPVVMLTVNDKEGEAQGLAADEFLTKPFEADVLAATVLRQAARSGNNRTVLVVDDEDDARQLLSRPLEAMGWRILHAGSGSQGLAMFAEERPGMILLDLLMPEMDGFEFLSRLRNRPDGKTTPVVVVTAKDLTESERQKLKQQAATVLAKGSFRLTDLLEQLVLLVARSHT